MATQYLIQVPTNLKFGILWILHLSSTVICTQNDPSSHHKVGKFNLIIDHLENTNPNSICCMPCSQKILINSYFEKHIDMDFRESLLPELCLYDSCRDLVFNTSSIVKLSALQRHLTGEGSHRRLVSSIKVDIKSEPIVELSLDSCEAIIINRLPSGVFVDHYELKRLVQRGAFTDAAVFGDTNLELPSTHSHQSIVEAHIDIDRSSLGLEISSELPLHARYPPLGDSDYSTVEIKAPDVLIRCKDGSYEDVKCMWLLFGWDTKAMVKSIEWQIPCGNKAHAGLVSTVTAVSALVSAFVIVIATIHCSSSRNEL